MLVDDREAVLRAIAEFDSLGREAFLAKYGFGRAREFFLFYNGRFYDSKAIVGAAHGVSSVSGVPLAASDFSGGEQTVKKTLNTLGFTVIRTRLSEVSPSGETRAVILTWNPDRWEWPDRSEVVRRFNGGESVRMRWSSGNTRTLPIGTRAFLLKQGAEPRGFVASGWTISSPFEAPHWDDELAAKGGTANYVEVLFDTVLADESEPLDPRNSEGALSQINWAIPSSGTSINGEAYLALETLWAARERHSFHPNRSYTRSDITRALGIEAKPSGDWLTGYHREGDEMFIFAAVNAAGRTGHDYQNEWLRSDRFRWFGTTNSKRTDAKIAPMLSREVTTHIFWRSLDRGPFTYAGVGVPVAVTDSVPIQIVWDVLDPSAADDSKLPEELDDSVGQYPVGAGRQVTVNKYERSRAARKECIAHYGAACLVCGFDFGIAYGAMGHGYIHVHHLVTMAELAKRFAETGVEYILDPVRDLRPVCANCHAMIHSRREPYAIEELRKLLT
ncbi:DUF3427 domain-containing protein [Gemmatimonas groenlandica]|uniref:DUF3427 domain-containing protein n=1 Tax=Gemmatimonas groenlandica TaxID=2732249 RepID=A0A6M4IKE9_9BACT|nr:DUF3427 domain-containing protein [Gemmatimonas groenlandica]QJR35213.1 DUF3427 domain-containing protein [Gemmatimonas groenlandica]